MPSRGSASTDGAGGVGMTGAEPSPLDGAVDAEAFARAIDTGLGRPILWLQRDAAGLATPGRDALARACRHNTAYDPQVEGSRAAYVFEMLQLTGEERVYRDQILSALAAVTEYWDARQLFALAGLFARQGDAVARQAMYDKFVQNDTEQRFTGAEALIALDGLDGLLFAVDFIGRVLRADPDLWEDDALIRGADEVCGREVVQRTLDQARATNPHVATYLDRVEQARRSWKEAAAQRPDIPALSYGQLRRHLAGRGSRTGVFGLQRWGEQAAPAALERAAADLLREEDPERLRAYLHLFRRRPFPFAPGRLLALAHHEDERVARAALVALSQVAHPDVRRLALDLLGSEDSDGDRKGDAVELLVSNYRDGDHASIETLLHQEHDRDALHDVGFGALRVLETHPKPEHTRALLILYERGPCSECRERCVDQLHALGAVPRWMLEECRFDANTDIRSKATQWAQLAEQ